MKTQFIVSCATSVLAVCVFVGCSFLTTSAQAQLNNGAVIDFTPMGRGVSDVVVCPCGTVMAVAGQGSFQNGSLTSVLLTLNADNTSFTEVPVGTLLGSTAINRLSENCEFFTGASQSASSGSDGEGFLGVVSDPLNLVPIGFEFVDSVGVAVSDRKRPNNC